MLHKIKDDTGAIEVLDYELCFYDSQPPALTGLGQDFLSSARLDIQVELVGEVLVRFLRTEAGKEGWIAEGYLDTNAPPTLRLAQLETETSSLRTQLEETIEAIEAAPDRAAEAQAHRKLVEQIQGFCAGLER